LRCTLTVGKGGSQSALDGGRGKSTTIAPVERKLSGACEVCGAKNREKGKAVKELNLGRKVRFDRRGKIHPRVGGISGKKKQHNPFGCQKKTIQRSARKTKVPPGRKNGLIWYLNDKMLTLSSSDREELGGMVRAICTHKNAIICVHIFVEGDGGSRFRRPKRQEKMGSDSSSSHCARIVCNRAGPLKDWKRGGNTG